MLTVITNRHLCKGSFIKRIEAIAAAQPDRIILREKDLDTEAYLSLARECYAICNQYSVPFSINSNLSAAEALSLSAIHLPYNQFMEQAESLVQQFQTIGVSIHSIEETKKASASGASYLIAGHIFETGCKKGVAPRGLEFLQAVCKASGCPVYGIGGIHKKEAPQVLQAGAAGFCIMSELMECSDPYQRVKAYQRILPPLNDS